MFFKFFKKDLISLNGMFGFNLSFLLLMKCILSFLKFMITFSIILITIIIIIIITWLTISWLNDELSKSISHYKSDFP
jgi:hypothetical protein